MGPQTDSWAVPREAGSSGLSTEPQPSSLPTRESERPFSKWGSGAAPPCLPRVGLASGAAAPGSYPCRPHSLWGQMSISIAQGGRVSAKNSSLWPHLKNSRLVLLVSRIPSWTSRCDLRRLGWASTRITCSFPGIPTPGSFPRIGSLSLVTSLGPTGGLRLPPALCSPCCSPLWDGIVRACLGAHCPPLPAEDKPPGSGLATAEAPAPR